MRKSDETLSSLRKALALLELLRDQDDIGVSEAARKLQIGRSTAHRILSTMEQAGFLRQDENTRRYRAGLVLTNFGSSTKGETELRRVARPWLERFSESLGETTSLIVLEGSNVHFVESVEGTQVLRVAERTGARQPAHCNSVGKAILASLSTEEFHRVYPSDQLSSLTDDSITSRDELEKQLELIRERGYATNQEESEPGLAAVGVASPPESGLPRWGIGVSIPLSRATSERIESIAGALDKNISSIRQELLPPAAH